MDKGIKESLELLEGIEVLAVSLKKISKDGISLADLPEALELLKKFDVLLAAGHDVQEVIEEGKDLDQAELIALGSKIVSIVKKIKEA